tara:strand:- start:733 stop:1017 length:285 start_codon:yes stop_codon:yes gene_type:complete
MTKATKKIQRRIKKAKKKHAEAELKEKISMFSQLEDFCLVCEKPFDKQNKDMVQSWYVIVRKEQNKVNLYCPKCWAKATDLVNKLKEEINAEQS